MTLRQRIEPIRSRLKFKWIMREGNPMTSPYPLILKSKSLATLLAVLVNLPPEVLK